MGLKIREGDLKRRLCSTKGSAFRATIPFQQALTGIGSPLGSRVRE